MEPTVKYECPRCFKTYRQSVDAAECLAKHVDQDSAWERATKDALARACEIAKESRALKMLAAAEETEAAQWVASELYDQVGFYSNSSWFDENAFKLMVATVTPGALDVWYPGEPHPGAYWLVQIRHKGKEKWSNLFVLPFSGCPQEFRDIDEALKNVKMATDDFKDASFRILQIVTFVERIIEPEQETKEP